MVLLTMTPAIVAALSQRTAKTEFPSHARESSSEQAPTPAESGDEAPAPAPAGQSTASPRLGDQANTQSESYEPLSPPATPFPYDDAETEKKPECKSPTETNIEKPNTVVAGPSEESCLDNPAIGNPISHAQIIALWKDLRTRRQQTSLEGLLKGAVVHVPPPPPKPEPSAEYKALMARLRRQEEARVYARMTTATTSTSPSSALASPDALDDEAMAAALRETNEQVRVIFNFAVTVLGVGAAVFVLARWWDGPWRVLLALGSALATAVAEGVVYWIYVERTEERKRREKGKDGKRRGVGGEGTARAVGRDGGGDKSVGEKSVGEKSVGEKSGGDGVRKRIVTGADT